MAVLQEFGVAPYSNGEKFDEETPPTDAAYLSFALCGFGHFPARSRHIQHNGFGGLERELDRPKSGQELTPL
jgi:hypothetical protein